MGNVRSISEVRQRKREVSSSAPALPFPGDYDELRHELTRAVRRICPQWLADHREDLVQVALTRVIQAQRKKGDAQPYAASYLWRAAYSALIDEIRLRRRKQEVPLDEEDDTAVPANTHPGPHEHTAGRQAGQAIRECLTGLINARRLAVALHLKGHTIAEAAKLLGFAAKRTENLIYRGLGDLRRCLSAKGWKP